MQGRQELRRVGKEGATDPRREGTVFELGRDSWEGATQLGVWVAVSRFLKFPILGNFAEIIKSRLRPSGRTLPRLAVGGYTRRSDGEQWERASSKDCSVVPASCSLLEGMGKDAQGLPVLEGAPQWGLPSINLLREGCSGQWPRHLPAVTCKGNQVPVYGVLLSRGFLRSAGESTLTARATSAPFQQRPCLCRAASEKILQALGSTP